MAKRTQHDERLYRRMREELGVSAEDALDAVRGLRVIRQRDWDYTWEDDFEEETGDKINMVKLLDEDGTEIARGWDLTFSDIGQAYEAGGMAFHEDARMRALPPAPNPKTFPTGTVVKRTGKFLKSIGMPTRGAVDGIVLGSNRDGLLVAWSDGHTGQILARNVQKTKKQMDAATAKATVTAERRRARQTMDAEMWSPEEIDEVVASYVRDDLAANPPRPNPAPLQATSAGLVGRLKF